MLESAVDVQLLRLKLSALNTAGRASIRLWDGYKFEYFACCSGRTE
jgi:hypothetical protein